MTPPSFTSGELADRFGLDLRGDAGLRIDGVATLARAEPGQLAFLANSRYRAQLADSRASLVVLRAEDAADATGAVLVAKDPYTAFAKMAALFERKPVREAGIHPSAVIDPSARVAPGAHVGPFVMVGARSVIGDSSRLGYLGRRAVRNALVDQGNTFTAGKNAFLREQVFQAALQGTPIQCQGQALGQALLQLGNAYTAALLGD